MTVIWSAPVSPAEAHRRAGGRRRYNAERQRLAADRRRDVERLVIVGGCSQAHAARVLGVHRSTIKRDVDRLRADSLTNEFTVLNRLLSALAERDKKEQP